MHKTARGGQHFGSLYYYKKYTVLARENQEKRKSFVRNSKKICTFTEVWEQNDKKAAKSENLCIDAKTRACPERQK